MIVEQKVKGERLMDKGKLISELAPSERRELLDRMREADQLLRFAVREVRACLREHEQDCVECEDCRVLREMLSQAEEML